MSTKKQNLVIVESPAKAKTLSTILGSKYEVMASLGHVRDLPKKALGVDIEHGFEPKYVTIREKSKIIKELRQEVEKADTVFLATDPDREGEAIAWHIAQVTDLEDKPYWRVTFHEITERAVKEAFKEPRQLDYSLINAQQARRILDRLVGYKLSPVLWRKIKRGLSAGRVQSAALRLIVERDRQIELFKPEEYWSLEATLEKEGYPAFSASLVGLENKKPLVIKDKEEAERLQKILTGASYSVLGVKKGQTKKEPPPPFITSTLQQEAAQKLHFPAEKTMRLAQQLYEGLPIRGENVGLITYMRTDSINIASVARDEIRQFILEHFGQDFLSPRARVFRSKVKSAQEAHEAIRPTSIQRTPESLEEYLSKEQLSLYRLIWQRALASQMASALFRTRTVDILAQSKEANYILRASSTTSIFSGFLALYKEEGKEETLPELEKGDQLKLVDINTQQHFTQPPPHFTEASLIKTLEESGIGRPSTYAVIVPTLLERGYVERMRGSLRSTELGGVVTDFLNSYFTQVVDIDFTAHMEDELDKIAHEGKEWVNVVEEFYRPLEGNLNKAMTQAQKVKLAEQPLGQNCPQCGRPLLIKDGRYGKFIACSGFPECRYTGAYNNTTGIKCPECHEGELLEKRSRRGKVFYACSRYPECRFTLGRRPLNVVCPQCGAIMVSYRKDMARCSKCGYKGKLDAEGNLQPVS